MTKGWRVLCRKYLFVVWMLLIIMEAVTVGGESRVKLEGGGYKDLLIGISPNLDESLGGALIKVIKVIIQETSNLLFQATHGRLYFQEAVILIPKHWTNITTDNLAEGETIEDSDILIKEKHSVYGDQPYTQQPEGCGRPGRFIHLTPQFLTNDTVAKMWGTRGILLLQEWAKLRWGVFDEVGYANDKSHPRFYMDDAQELFVPTFCTDKPVMGRSINTENGQEFCPWSDPLTYNQKCRFQAKMLQTAASSLMSYTGIKNANMKEFCDTSDSAHPHNTKAPTKQNKMCNGRSIWEVMRDHPDFADYVKYDGSLTTGTTAEPAKTIFKTKRHAIPNYALVLDYSGSMTSHDRIHKMVRETRRWLLRSVAPESKVAIIRFSTEASIFQGLTEIVGDESRRTLADSLDTNASGLTCIGCGLLKAIEILSGRENKVILLLTDGEETVDINKVVDVMPNVTKSGARVVTIAFGPTASETLEAIALETYGKTYTVNDLDEGTMMEAAFEGSLTYQPPPEKFVNVIEIYSGPGSREGKFSIDSTVGRNTVFRVSQKIRQHVTPALNLTSPNGVVYGDAQIDSLTDSWSITVLNAEVGEWRWNMGLSESDAKSTSIKVTSQAKDPDMQPIITDAWLSSGSFDVNATKDTLTIFAEVKQGNNPVVNANVRAFVTPPTDDAPEEYILLDNGEGADTVAGDGIYARYMTKFKGEGRYGVKAEVTDGGRALINTGGDFLTRARRKRFAKRSISEEYDDYVNIDGPEYCCGSVMPLDPNSAKSTGSFSRVAVAGSVKIVNVPSQADFLPPLAVRNLEVTLIKSSQLHVPLYNVSLSWTATGDDLDSGIVSGYVIRMSTNRSHLTESTFDEAPFETELGINATEMNLLVEAGTLIYFTIAVEMNPTPGSSYYFALKAIDDEGHKSPVSNVVAIKPALYAKGEPPISVIPSWSIALMVIVAAVIMIIIGTIVGRSHAKYEVVQMHDITNVSQTTSGNIV